MSVTTPSVSLTPFFLEHAPQRRVFALLFAPPANVALLAPVLHVAAFAEEMNKSRRAVALAARTFAGRGAPTLIIDPTGTGDSSHDFADAAWHWWIEDYLAAYDWLANQYRGVPLLWALRFGALLLPELLTARVATAARRLLLWNPALSGAQLLTQFLRLKLAADLAQPAASGEVDAGAAAPKGLDTKELRRQLQAGDSIEIAGYELTGALASALDRAALAASHIGPGTHVGCFEALGQTATASTLTPALRKFVADLRAKSVHVTEQGCAEPAFWSTPEITTAPTLVAASANFVAARGASA